MRFKEEKCPREVFNLAFLQTWKEGKRPSSSALYPGRIILYLTVLKTLFHSSPEE